MLPGLTTISPDRWSKATREWLDGSAIQQAVLYDIPLTVQFRSVTSRQGLLLQGSKGWGECAPFGEYQPGEASTWLLSAVEEANREFLPIERAQVPVNVTIPVVSPTDAALRAQTSGCWTAKIKVADPRATLTDDYARVKAVSETLSAIHGRQAKVRIDVNGIWEKDEACRAIEFLNRAASAVGGLEYVEQPCATVEELAYVRQRVATRIAADESVRRAEDPLKVVEFEAADLAVIKVSPLGGARAAIEIAKKLAIPVVISSAIDTSIGLSSGVELAGALPQLPFACGLDTRRLLKSDVTSPGLRSEGGTISVELAQRLRSGALVTEARPVDRKIVDCWVSRIEKMINFLQSTHDSRY